VTTSDEILVNSPMILEQKSKVLETIFKTLEFYAELNRMRRMGYVDFY
jgi:hypothetical protein